MQTFWQLISESGNISLNSLFACSLVKKARLCFAVNKDHIASALMVLCWMSGLKKDVTDLDVEATLAISLWCFVLTCAVTSFFPPCDILKSEEHSVHRAYVSPKEHQYLTVINDSLHDVPLQLFPIPWKSAIHLELKWHCFFALLGRGGILGLSESAI